MDTGQSLLTRYHEQSDASAFQDLVLAHGGMVFATARRITQDAGLAEEVAQEVFLTLARRGQDIRGSVAAWLHQVAKQKACNVIRGESRRRHYEQAAAPGLHTTPESTWAEIEPLVDEALAELPEPVRGLLIEHYLERRTQADIAKRLGLNQSTVSRQLESGLQRLRDILRRKGVICSAGLGALLLEGAAATAVPATLTASLLKMGLSGIGSQTAAVVSASAATTITALKLKVAAALLGVLGIGWVASDLASQESRLARWFGAKPDEAAAADASAGTGASNASTDANSLSQKERWAVEAKEIWANAARFDRESLGRFVRLLNTKPFPNAKKLFTEFHSIGVTISRDALDRSLENHLRVFKTLTPSLSVFDYWVPDSPREAVAWAYEVRGLEVTRGDMVYSFLSRATDAIQKNPGAWAAFLAASPDPRIAALSDLCLAVEADPAALWSHGDALGLNADFLETAASHCIRKSEPAKALEMLALCLDPNFKLQALLDLTPRLLPTQLLRLADELAADADLANFLKAMAGSPSASFSEAAAYAQAASRENGISEVKQQWAAKCVEKIYSQWPKLDLASSLTEMLGPKNRKHLESYMVAAVRTANLSEETLVAALKQGSRASQRDAVLAAFYRAQADGDPADTLHRISQSASISDQIEAAKPILKQWSEAAPEAAAQWLQSLPASEDHAELAAVIVSGWAKSDATAAVAFSHQYGLSLAQFTGELAEDLALSMSDDPDAVVTSLLLTFRDDVEFNRLVVLLGGHRLQDEPAKALGFMAAHANPGWQTEIVRQTTGWLDEGIDRRAEDFGLALAGQNLSSVPSGDIIELTKCFVYRFKLSDRLPEALDWTLKLPSDVAPQARAAAIGQFVNFKPAERRQIDQWLTRAPLDAAERAGLRQQLQQQAASAAMPQP